MAPPSGVFACLGKHNDFDKQTIVGTRHSFFNLTAWLVLTV